MELSNNTSNDGAANTLPPPGMKHEPIFTLGFLDPSEMTPEERTEELAGILASAILRLKKPEQD